MLPSPSPVRGHAAYAARPARLGCPLPVPGSRDRALLDHLMHCVVSEHQPVSTAQCRPGQTPDFPAGHYPNHTAGALISSSVGGDQK